MFFAYFELLIAPVSLSPAAAAVVVFVVAAVVVFVVAAVFVVALDFHTLMHLGALIRAVS